MNDPTNDPTATNERTNDGCSSLLQLPLLILFGCRMARASAAVGDSGVGAEEVAQWRHHRGAVVDSAIAAIAVATAAASFWQNVLRGKEKRESG